MSELEAWETLLGLTRLGEPWAVRVAATLRLADLLSSESRPVGDLAASSDADPDALGRLLRFLVVRGLFAEPAPGLFALNDAARLLLDDHPGHMRRWLDLEGAGGAMDRAYSGLLDTVRSGAAAYPKLNGRSFWQDLAGDGRLAESFASLMEAHSSELSEDVVNRYAWDEATVVVDVGGGTGALLARILQSYPLVRGVLVDLVADSPDAAALLESAGVSDRCRPIARDFFDSLPSGGDVYVLRNVIHDRPDEQAATILRRCAEAAGETGRVLVVERVMTECGDQRELTGMDLRMLALFASKERSLEEFNALATGAGLTLESASETRSAYWLLEYHVAKSRAA